MSEFLAENWGSLLVGAVVLALVTLIIIKLVRDKKAGKYTCGGNCGSCGACAGGHRDCHACTGAHSGTSGKE